MEGDWEGWLDFFLDGVATIADEAVASARELFALVAEDRTRVLATEKMSIGALRLFELLPRHPIVTVASAMKLLRPRSPTAGKAIELLVAAGVLIEFLRCCSVDVNLPTLGLSQRQPAPPHEGAQGG